MIISAETYNVTERGAIFVLASRSQFNTKLVPDVLSVERPFCSGIAPAL